MYDVCFKLLPLFHVLPRDYGKRTTMIEEFLTKLLAMLRGTVDATEEKKAGTHGCREKITSIAGHTMELKLPSGIHLVVDLWEQSYVAFNQAARVTCNLSSSPATLVTCPLEL